jgi:hypothetical protein
MKEVNLLALLAELWGGHHPVPRKRKLVALGIGGLTDLLEIVVFPLFWQGGASPLDLALDVLTAGALWLILGFKARLLLGFVLELVPGLTLFPTWTALVLSIPSEGAAAEPGAPMKNITPQPQEPQPPQAALPEPPAGPRTTDRE